MSIVNNIAKSWIDKEVDALEEYKYVNEGTERTPGSYYLTFKKSLNTMADEDPGMFEIEAMSRVTPVTLALIAGVAIGTTVGTVAVNKIKKHVQNKKSKKQEASLEEKESN